MTRITNRVHSECPLCNNTNLEPAFSDGARDHVTGERFEILRCRACDVAFTSPFPDSMDTYYPDKYRGYGPVVTTVLRIFYRLRLRRINSLRKNSDSHALEIGCGAGIMLQALRQSGWQVTGLERTDKMAASLQNELGLDVLSKDISELPDKRVYDLIIMFNVLEHLNNPADIIIECAKRLRPGGTLLVSVPNFHSWQSRFSTSQWLHLDPPRHLFHFTPESLGKVLTTAGLRQQHVSFVSWEHDPYGWVESVINMITGEQNKLTRYLMGIEPFGFSVVLSILLALLLVIPATVLSIVSWITGNGALFESISVLGDKDTI